MNSFLSKLFSSYKRTVGIVGVLVITLAVPITLILISQQQDVRQRAASIDISQPPKIISDPVIPASSPPQSVINTMAAQGYEWNPTTQKWVTVSPDPNYAERTPTSTIKPTAAVTPALTEKQTCDNLCDWRPGAFSSCPSSCQKYNPNTAPTTAQGTGGTTTTTPTSPTSPATTSTATIPARPTSVNESVSCSGNTAQATLTWSPVSGATSYVVSYFVNTLPTGSSPTPTTATGTSYTVSNLKSGDIISWSVSAQNSAGKSSAYSSVYQVSCEGSTSPSPTTTQSLSIPQNLNATSSCTTTPPTVTFTWSPVNGATSYIVTKLITPQATVQTIGTTASTSLQYNSVTSGEIVIWAVMAKNATGESQKANASLIVCGGSGTQIQLAAALPGIGSATGANRNPKNATRNAEVKIFNSQNQEVKSATGNIVFDSNNGQYKGAISLGTGFTTGSYNVKVRLNNSLWKLIPGIQTITSGTTNTLALATLISGDINQDNELNLTDYNMMLDCINNRSACNATNKTRADLNDDNNNNIDSLDLNILLRGIAIRKGD